MSKFFIVQDGNTIAGIGRTPDEARTDAAEWADTVDEVQECTPALYAKVEAEGGCISWAEREDGIACTIAERDLAALRKAAESARDAADTIRAEVEQAKARLAAAVQARDNWEPDDNDLEYAFQSVMEELYPDQIDVCGVEMDPVRILREMDPVAWRQSMLGWFDAESKDGNLEAYFTEVKELREEADSASENLGMLEDDLDGAAEELEEAVRAYRAAAEELGIVVTTESKEV